MRLGLNCCVTYSTTLAIDPSFGTSHNDAVGGASKLVATRYSARRTSTLLPWSCMLVSSYPRGLILVYFACARSWPSGRRDVACLSCARSSYVKTTAQLPMVSSECMQLAYLCAFWDGLGSSLFLSLSRARASLETLRVRTGKAASSRRRYVHTKRLRSKQIAVFARR